MKQSNGSLFQGVMLVTGTTVGGGMLALPVITSPAGFFPSVFIFILCWLFMTLTGLLFLELSLQMEEGVNIMSMAKKTLGRGGEIFAWVLYLFLFYCLTVAYVVGCGDILTSILPFDAPRSFGGVLFVALFSPFIYVGSKAVSKINSLMMVGLIVSFLGFIVIGANSVEMKNLMVSDFSLSLIALPITFISFAYQGVIPSLVSHLNRDKTLLRKSIWIGSFFSLLIYIIWAWLILGIIPFEGENGLNVALNEGRSAVYPLHGALNHPWIFAIGELFAFFALITSFFGVTLGLFDFLADALKIEKTSIGKFQLLGLVFGPPLLISLIYPKVFLTALDLAGGYGSALLLGLLPIVMVYVWRKRHPEGEKEVGGGKMVLALMTAFVLLELTLELLKL